MALTQEQQNYLESEYPAAASPSSKFKFSLLMVGVVCAIMFVVMVVLMVGLLVPDVMNGTKTTNDLWHMAWSQTKLWIILCGVVGVPGALILFNLPDESMRGRYCSCYKSMPAYNSTSRNMYCNKCKGCLPINLYLR